MALMKYVSNIWMRVVLAFGTMMRRTLLNQLSPMRSPVVSQPAFIFESAVVDIR